MNKVDFLIYFFNFIFFFQQTQTQQVPQPVPQPVPQLSTVTATTPAVSSVPRMTPVTGPVTASQKRVVINAPPPPVKSEIVTKSIVQAQQPRSRIVTQVPPRQVHQVQQASPPIRSRYHSRFFFQVGHKTIDAFI